MNRLHDIAAYIAADTGCKDAKEVGQIVLIVLAGFTALCIASVVGW